MIGRIIGVIFIGIGVYIGWIGVQVMLSGPFEAITIVIVGFLLLCFGTALSCGVRFSDIIGDLFIRMP